MKTILDSKRSFAAAISEMIGQNIDGCYQCGKCTAGCPVAYLMDFSPQEMMRLVQLGQEQKALASHTIWLCASCETCTSRCPKNIDVVAVMDALRVLAFRRGQTGAEKEITLFHKLFLRVVGRFGRVNDLQLMGRYNFSTGNLFRDWRLGQKLFAKGRLRLTSPPVPGLQEFQKILARVEAVKGEKP